MKPDTLEHMAFEATLGEGPVKHQIQRERTVRCPHHQLGLDDGDARIDVGRKRIRPATREGRVRCEVEITATIIAILVARSASSSSTSILAGSQTSISIGTFAVSRSAQSESEFTTRKGASPSSGKARLTPRRFPEARHVRPRS